MDFYGRVTSLLLHLHEHGERASRSFLSAVLLFLCCFEFSPVLINGQKKGGKCVLEFLGDFI